MKPDCSTGEPTREHCVCAGSSSIHLFPFSGLFVKCICCRPDKPVCVQQNIMKSAIRNKANMRGKYTFGPALQPTNFNPTYKTVFCTSRPRHSIVLMTSFYNLSSFRFLPGSHSGHCQGLALIKSSCRGPQIFLCQKFGKTGAWLLWSASAEGNNSRRGGAGKDAALSPSPRQHPSPNLLAGLRAKRVAPALSLLLFVVYWPVLSHHIRRVQKLNFG